MKIVIDIPEDEYQALVDMRDCGLGFYHEIILNGKILDKDLDLVDRNTMEAEYACTYDGNHECVKSCSCEECPESEYQCYTDIRDLPTIIRT